ncbi:MAG: 30S ribosomal protein S7 [bacterium]
MRRPVKNRNIVKEDIQFNSEKISKFINYVMGSGKKNAARKIVYGALEKIKEDLKVENPLEIFESALKNTGPLMEVRSRRVGGANYQVPREIRPQRRDFLSMKWIIEAARNKKGKPMHIKLAEEIVAAHKNEGEAVKKRENTHKMADANKAFAHFAW